MLLNNNCSIKKLKSINQIKIGLWGGVPFRSARESGDFSGVFSGNRVDYFPASGLIW